MNLLVALLAEIALLAHFRASFLSSHFSFPSSRKFLGLLSVRSSRTCSTYSPAGRAASSTVTVRVQRMSWDAVQIGSAPPRAYKAKSKDQLYGPKSSRQARELARPMTRIAGVSSGTEIVTVNSTMASQLRDTSSRIG
jgi:hypothetical protein